ncbi:MAG: hypothetical protein ACNA78_10750 [Balneolaceae bacterium]
MQTQNEEPTNHTAESAMDEKEIKQAIEQEKEKVEDMYDEVISRMGKERDRIVKELNHEYRNARRYVRENPEAGVGTAFAAGILAGAFFTWLLGKK